MIEALGDGGEVAGVYEQVWVRFQLIFGEFVDELVWFCVLVGDVGDVFSGLVVRCMGWAVGSHYLVFVTLMAVVVGVVVDEILVALVAGCTLDKVYVNNGGDIVFYLVFGQFFRTGIVMFGWVLCFDGFI